jgi:hypothetical protein
LRPLHSLLDLVGLLGGFPFLAALFLALTRRDLAGARPLLRFRVSLVGAGLAASLAPGAVDGALAVCVNAGVAISAAPTIAA